MDKEAALRAMQKLVDEGPGDIEAQHSEADDILCAFLRHLGHDSLVDLYMQVEKWYA